MRTFQFVIALSTNYIHTYYIIIMHWVTFIEINYHLCTGDVQSSILMSSVCSLFCSGVAILKHERAELWELKMLNSDWFIFNCSQVPVPRTCSHEGPSKILRGPVPATGPTNSNWFEFVGPISGTKIQSLQPEFWRKLACSHNGIWSPGPVPATGSPRVWRP